MPRRRQNPLQSGEDESPRSALVVNEFERAGIRLTGIQVARLTAYLREVCRWNQVVNLTAVRDETGVVRTLLVSSALWPLPAGWESGARFLDVGSGAGIPGLPLKILHPESEWTLLDRSRRKGTFLTYVAGLLQMRGLDVVCADLREFARQTSWLACFDGIVSRAALRLPKILSACLPLLRPGGMLLTQKGEGVEGEIEEARSSCRRFGGEFEALQDIPDPWGGRLRFVCYRKRES